MLDGWIGIVTIMGFTVGIPMFVAMCPLAGWTGVVFVIHLTLIWFLPKTGIFIALVVAAWRLWMALPSSDYVWPSKAATPRSRILVVLGNGDHTDEMMYDMGTVEDWRDKFDATYIAANSDKKSQSHANTFEHDIRGRDASVYFIPYACKEGEKASLVGLFRGVLAAARAVFMVWPDVIVCNGSSTCVPVIMAAYIPRFFMWKRITLVYAESLANVDQLSTTGSTLYQWIDVFVVQWDPLYRHCYSVRWKHGHLLHGGRCRDGEKLKALPVEQQEGDGTCLVTVGPDQFDDLIRSIDTEDFLKALAALGIKKLKVQKGDGLYAPVVLIGEDAKEAGIEVDVIQFSSTLPEEVQSASLIISHASASTVVDGLNHSRRMLIVPNEELSDNQEVKLCEELKKYGLVRWSRCSDIVTTLNGYTGSELRKFPEAPTGVFATVLRQITGRPNKEEKEERNRARSRYDRYGNDRY